MQDDIKRQDMATDNVEGMNVRQVIAGVLIFYVLVLALNVEALHRSVEHLPYGPVRTFWTAVTGPAAQVSRRLHLGRPRALLTETLGARLNRD